MYTENNWLCRRTSVKTFVNTVFVDVRQIFASIACEPSQLIKRCCSLFIGKTNSTSRSQHLQRVWISVPIPNLAYVRSLHRLSWTATMRGRKCCMYQRWRRSVSVQLYPEEDIWTFSRRKRKDGWNVGWLVFICCWWTYTSSQIKNERIMRRIWGNVNVILDDCDLLYISGRASPLCLHLP